jgi:RNA polymerase sigma-70 factor (ECF subfamily)
MTHEPGPGKRERARLALERSLRSAAPPSNEPPDPELLARLEAALSSLPRLRREIFLAVRLDARTYGEIARTTGLSTKQVERHVARAIAQIDRYLEHGETSPFRSWWRRFWRR